jgi:hypothetical protein
MPRKKQRKRGVFFARWPESPLDFLFLPEHSKAEGNS